MARIIYSNGIEKAVEPKNGTDFSLEEMRDIVGGYIEIATIRNQFGERDEDNIMVVNEEGKLMGLPVNWKASQLHFFADLIVGDVLVCRNSEVR